MKTNLGKADRIIRMILAIGITYLAYTGIIGGVLSIIMLLVSFILMVTGMVGTCPLYSLLGINSCHQPSSKQPR